MWDALASPVRWAIRWLRTDALKAEWDEIGEEAARIAYSGGRSATTLDDVVIYCLRDPQVFDFLFAFDVKSTDLQFALEARVKTAPPAAEREAASRAAYQRVLMTSGRDRRYFGRIDRVGLLLGCLAETVCVARAVFEEHDVPLRRLIRALLQEPPPSASLLHEVCVINDPDTGAGHACSALQHGLSIPHHVSHPLMMLIEQEGRVPVFIGLPAEAAALHDKLQSAIQRWAPSLKTSVSEHRGTVQ